MPTNYGGRLLLTAAVLLVCLFGFPWIGGGLLKTTKLFDHIPFSQKTNLKPGIDIAGGTSLTYEIKLPPGDSGRSQSGLSRAEEVAAALKKRVDPNGVANLIWRPQGDTRLEIQIPRSSNAGDREKAQKALSQAIDEFKRTTFDVELVKRAIEKLTGAERDKQLEELAGGSKEQLALFKSLAARHDEVEKAKADYAAAEKRNDVAAKNNAADAQALASIAYDKELEAVVANNLALDELQNILSLPDDARATRLSDLKKKYKDFPARVAAIERYATADAQFKKFKGSLDDVEDLKRMLRGSGVLEFHILVIDLQSSEARDMIARLKANGPAPKAGDTMRWYVVDNPDEFKGHQTFSTDSDPTKKYALAYITPDKQMVHERTANPWALEDARATRDPSSGNAVSFSFDAQSAKLFSELTRTNTDHPLAIVLDDRMISAPNIHTEIGANGIITGGGTGGFEPKEQKYLVNTLAAGSLPATLADEPTSEHTVSPLLGADNLYRGLLASGIGLIVVSVFLI